MALMSRSYILIKFMGYIFILHDEQQKECSFREKIIFYMMENIVDWKECFNIEHRFLT
jgi:hypothetical protein